jgi:hypothetical protein
MYYIIKLAGINMVKHISIIFVFIILLGGCNSRQVDESVLHTINFQYALKNISEEHLSKYVSSIKYTPIETHPSALLGSINQWFTANDSLMLFVSANQQKCIHVFTKDGKYIKDIGSLGNGPGEYLAVRTMTIIPEDNTLFVEGGIKSVTYSLSDGKCISSHWFDEFSNKSRDIVQKYKGRESVAYNMSMWSIVFHNNNIYSVAGDNTTLDQYFMKVKSDFTIDTIIPMRQTTLGVGLPRVVCGQIYLYNDKINVIHGLQDTIYTWEDESLVPRILIEFGDIPSIKTRPQIKKTDSFFHPRSSHLRGKFGKMVIASGCIFTETDKFIIGSVFLPVDIVKAYNLKQTSEFLYDKKTRKTKLIKHSEDLGGGAFTNDIDGGMPFWPTKHIGNKLYQFVDAGTFIEMSKKYNSPRMKEIAATLTEESNPVMIEATLK